MGGRTFRQAGAAAGAGAAGHRWSETIWNYVIFLAQKHCKLVHTRQWTKIEANPIA